MIAVLIEYIKIRIHLFQQIGLSLLMTILVLTLDDTFYIWMLSILFLLISFIVFRILDDAFSVAIDRKEHPERTYLNPSKFTSFKKITTISICIYLLSVGLVFSNIYFIILVLLISSLVFYFLLAKQLFILKIIPLVKYPVLLFCVSVISFHQVDPNVLFASFLLLAGFDLFDRLKINSNLIWQPLCCLFLCSLFLFKPWIHDIDMVYSVVPLLLIYTFRTNSLIPYVSILYFPITFFILTHL